MISGGSRGAEPINDAFISMIKAYEKADYEWFFHRDKHYESIKDRIEHVEQLKNVHILPFISNLPQYLVNMDLFVWAIRCNLLSRM